MKNDHQDDSSDIRYSKSRIRQGGEVSAQHISLRCLQERSRSRQNAFKCGYISCMMHYAEKYYADLEKCTRNLAETTKGVPTSFSENPSDFFVKKSRQITTIWIENLLCFGELFSNPKLRFFHEKSVKWVRNISMNVI